MPRKITKNTSRRTTPVDVMIGNKIRVRRIELGVSQEALGDALGLSFQQIQKYEKGVNRVGIGRLNEIAAALDCDVTFFVGDLKNGKKPAAVSRFAEYIATKEGSDIVEAMLKIESESVRRSVITLARSLGANLQ